MDLPTSNNLNPPSPNIDINKFLAAYPYIKLIQSSNILHIPKGNYQFKKDFVIPKNYQVHFTAGSTFSFANEAFLLSYSPIQVMGTKEEPVVFQALEESWPGLVVLNVKREMSNLAYFEIKQTRGIERPGWSLPGGCSFVKSPVQISHSFFNGSFAEDTLNVFNTHFKLEHLRIEGSASDAIDIDFSHGTMNELKFDQITADAIDFSGSQVEVSNVTALNVADKVLSVGEESNVDAKNVNSNSVNIGFAIKDNSTLNIKDSKVQNANIGSTAFRKKPEFPRGGTGNLKNIIWENVSQLYWLEKNATIVLDNVAQPVNKANIKEQLY